MTTTRLRRSRSQIAEKAARCHLMIIDVKKIGRAAAEIQAHGLVLPRDGGIRHIGFRRNLVHQRDMLADFLGVLHRPARRGRGEVLELFADFLRVDPNLFHAADSLEVFPHSFGDTRRKREHRQQTRHAEDDAQHGQKTAKLMRADFRQSDGDAEEEIQSKGAR